MPPRGKERPCSTAMAMRHDSLTTFIVERNIMSFTRILKRSASGYLLPALLVCLLMGASANLMSAGEKAAGQNLRPELALVLPDAFAFAHLRPAEVWQTDLVAALRQQYADPIAELRLELRKAIGVD